MTTVPGAHSRPDRVALGIDYWLLIATAILLAGGLAALASVDPNLGIFKSQIRFAVVGGLGLAVAAIISVERYRQWVGWLYTLNVGLLMLVLLFGDTRNGATRWIELGSFQFQPSELSKILIAITLSAYFHRRRDNVRSFRVFLGSALHILPVLALLMAQPHVGATLTVGVIWLGICVLAGVPWRAIIASTVVGIGLLAGLIAAVYTVDIPLFNHLKTRIDAKLTPDNTDNNWQVDQATIAIGVGGVQGAGFGQGVQKQGEYVPFQNNDFIFSVIGEEGGLIGSLLLLACYLFFFTRCWLITAGAGTMYGRCLAGGLTAAIGFHVVVNLGMNLGITPVIGLWLPFISSGGTALIMCLTVVGLMISIRRTA